MRRPSPLPRELVGISFSTRQAKQAGLTRARTRSGDLARPFHGVRSPAPSVTLDERSDSYVARMSPGHFFSHTTAALILGLRMPQSFRETELHVSAQSDARAPRGKGIVGHRAASGTRVVALPNGVRVSHPVDTWAMLGQTLTVDDLIVMGDGLLRRKNPLATLANLEAALETRRGCRGYRNLAAALPHVRARTDSARETIVRLIVIRAGFPEPEVNAAITDAFGTVIAHGDLTFRRYRVIIEYDGGQHRDDEYQFNIDIERLDRLMEEGWRVIRVNKQLLAQRAALVDKIRTALEAGGWRGEP